MPAPPLTNSLESGQPDTTTITAGNSGGAAGDAFSATAAVNIPTYSTTHVHAGSLAMKTATGGTYAETWAGWTGLGSITTSVYFRAYVYLTANPVTLQPRFFTARTASANSGFLSITTSGKVQSMNAAQAGSTAGTVSISLNQWVRLEWRVISSTTVGESEWWLYNSPEAAIASFDDHANNTGLVLGAVTDAVRFGPNTASGPANFDAWFDDLAVSSTGQIGPVVTTTTHDANIEWLHF